MNKFTWSQHWPRVLFCVLLITSLWVLGVGLTLNPQAVDSPVVGRQFPAQKLVSLSGETGDLAAEIDGKWTLVNFFASWCHSCRAEHDFIKHLHSKHPQLLVGVAYKDSNDEVAKFLTTNGDPYRRVWLDLQGQLAVELGVYGTPETFLVDNHGVIVVHHIGIMNEMVWDEKFARYVAKIKDVA